MRGWLLPSRAGWAGAEPGRERATERGAQRCSERGQRTAGGQHLREQRRRAFPLEQGGGQGAYIRPPVAKQAIAMTGSRSRPSGASAAPQPMTAATRTGHIGRRRARPGDHAAEGRADAEHRPEQAKQRSAAVQRPGHVKRQRYLDWSVQEVVRNGKEQQPDQRPAAGDGRETARPFRPVALVASGDPRPTFGRDCRDGQDHEGGGVCGDRQCRAAGRCCQAGQKRADDIGRHPGTDSQRSERSRQQYRPGSTRQHPAAYRRRPPHPRASRCSLATRSGSPAMPRSRRSSRRQSPIAANAGSSRRSAGLCLTGARVSRMSAGRITCLP